MDNFCVCCGAIVPEGRMVCPMCEMSADEWIDINDSISRVYKGKSKTAGGYRWRYLNE